MTTSKNQKPFKERRKFPRTIVKYDTDVNSNRGVVLDMSPMGVFIATALARHNIF